MNILGLFESMIDSGKPTIVAVGHRIIDAKKYAFCDSSSLPTCSRDEFIRYMKSGRALPDLPADNCLFSTEDGVHLHVAKEDGQRIRITVVMEEIKKNVRYYGYCPHQVLCDFSSPAGPVFKSELYYKARQIQKGILDPKADIAFACDLLVKCLSMLKRDDTRLVTVIESFPEEYPAFEYEESLTYQLVMTSDPKHNPQYYTLEQISALTGTTCHECEAILSDVRSIQVPA